MCCDGGLGVRRCDQVLLSDPRLLVVCVCFCTTCNTCVCALHCINFLLQAAGLKDRLQRSHAEMQNLIARQSREKETLQTYAVQVRTA